MRILVTGITGFVGGHLAEALLKVPGVELHGLSRCAHWPEDCRNLERRISLSRLDLCDASGLISLLQNIRPEQIYHLAGYAHAGKSLQDAGSAWSANLTATMTLYDAIVQWGGKPRILYVGSGLIYGDPETTGQRHTETSVLRPASPYASSKAAADLVSFQYTRTAGLDIVRTRPFNHIGPRQSPQYAVAHFAQQLAAIERGEAPPVLETGDLEPQRDLTDVRDVVQAYQMLMAHGRKGEAYNVASGQTQSMRTVVERLRRLIRVQVEVRKRATLLRSTENAVVCGDPGKLREETGWTPRYGLEQTLRDTLDYWRGQKSS
jgi:GDP-4-dehydro-6-deoxy-D-mannose reductase